MSATGSYVDDLTSQSFLEQLLTNRETIGDWMLWFWHGSDSWQQSMFFRLFLLILVEMLGVNRIWGERAHRRCLHHIEKDTRNPVKVPFMKTLRNYEPLLKHLPALRDLDLSYGDVVAGGGCQWRIMCTLAVAQYSPRATIYYDAMDETTRATVDAIGLDLAKHLSKVIGEDITLSPTSCSFRACILRYEGQRSEFPWHYDTEHPDCYRALFLFEKEGRIAPIEYVDRKGKVQTYHLEVADGWVFKGTRTLHRVPKTSDPNAKRYMLGFQFINEKTPEKVQAHVSICSMLRQATPAHIFWEFSPPFFLCWLVLLARRNCQMPDLI